MDKIQQSSPNNDFFAHFQPMRTLHDNHICGFEALARHATPTGEILTPSQFKSNQYLIDHPFYLFQVMLDEAANLIREAEKINTNSFFVSVNFGAHVLNKNNVEKYLEKKIQDNNISPQRLKLEISEIPFKANIHHVLATLQAIQRQNISFALDDFGTEHSNINRYTTLTDAGIKINTIKIDITLMPSIVGDTKIVKDKLEVFGLNKILNNAEADLKTFVLEGASPTDIQFFREYLGNTYQLLAQTHYYHKPMNGISAIHLLKETSAQHLT